MCVLHALAHYIYTRFVVLCEPFPACSPKDLNKPIFVALNNRGKADITYDGMVKVIKPYMLVYWATSTKCCTRFVWLERNIWIIACE